MCVRVGERFMLDPGTGMPVVYGIDLFLGDGVHLSGRSTFAGALRTDGRRPRARRRRRDATSATASSSAPTTRWSSAPTCASPTTSTSAATTRIRSIRWRGAAQPGPVDYSGASRIVIEDDVWICRGAIVLKGVRIGRGAVVGAHAVVTRDVPAGAVVAGNPAKVIGNAGDVELQGRAAERHRLRRPRTAGAGSGLARAVAAQPAERAAEARER